MKFLFVLLVVGGLGYIIYAQHARIENLQTTLDQNATQIRELQTKLAAQAAAAPQNPSYPNPLNNPPPQAPQPAGSSLLDKNHRGPLDR